MSNPTAPAILYAEDDPDDRLLAEMAHRESGAVNLLVFVADGEEALEYLRRSGRHADRAGAPQPGVILLDLNMPGIDGRETLRIIKADPVLRRIPVVILTTSTAQDDIATSYDAGTNSYIVKPSAFATLVQLFDRLCSYWFEIGSLAQEVRH
ncbi:MAG: response regulator [Chloroflexota bacterium]|nr:response regulator [Chloroflexota bacterium]